MILLALAASLAAPASQDTVPAPVDLSQVQLGEARPIAALPTDARAGEPAQTQPAPSRFKVQALGDTELGAEAGRADIAQDARNSQVAGVSGSSVNGTSRTGAVTIDGNAFQNMSGLTVVNANSGNNVAMNGAMTVNVAITPNP